MASLKNPILVAIALWVFISSLAPLFAQQRRPRDVPVANDPQPADSGCYVDVPRGSCGPNESATPVQCDEGAGVECVPWTTTSGFHFTAANAAGGVGRDSVMMWNCPITTVYRACTPHLESADTCDVILTDPDYIIGSRVTGDVCEGQKKIADR